MMNLSTYIQSFLARGARSWSAATTRSYTDLSKIICAHLGDLELCEITRSSIKDLDDAISDRGVSQRRLVFCLLRSVLHEAVEDDLISKVPKLPKIKDTRQACDSDALSIHDLKRALCELDEAYRPIFTFLAYTGARPAEAMALRWSDVNLERAEVTIRCGRVRGIEGTTKTKRTRSIPLLPQLVDILRALPRVSDHVFTRKDGQPFNRPLGDYWHAALKRAGLPPTASYHVRHSFATNSLAAGADLFFVSQMLGHSNIKTTSKYLRMSEAIKRKNMECLQSFTER